MGNNSESPVTRLSDLPADTVAFALALRRDLVKRGEPKAEAERAASLLVGMTLDGGWIERVEEGRRPQVEREQECLW